MAIALILLPMSNIKSCLECMNIDQAFKKIILMSSLSNLLNVCIMYDIAFYYFFNVYGPCGSTGNDLVYLNVKQCCKSISWVCFVAHTYEKKSIEWKEPTFCAQSISDGD